MRRLILAAVLCLVSSFASAQTCPTRPVGDSSNACASTAFVQTTGNGNFIQAGAGAVTRTMQNKVRERISVEDFGAVGDDTTDDSAAFAAAIASCTQLYSIFGCDIYLGAKRYKLNSTLVITDGISLIGAGSDASSLDFVSQTGTGLCGGCGILIGGVVDVSIQSLKIFKPFSHGIYIAGSEAGYGNPNNIKLSNITIGEGGAGTGSRNGAGVLLGTSFVINIENVVSQNNATHGFATFGTGSLSTSVTFTSTYALSNAVNGYSLANIVYSTFNSTASDFNGAYGYAMQEVSSLSFNAVGCETNADGCFAFVASNAVGTVYDVQAVTLNGVFAFNNGSAMGQPSFLQATSLNSRPIDILITNFTEFSTGATPPPSGNSILANGSTTIRKTTPAAFANSISLSGAAVIYTATYLGENGELSLAGSNLSTSTDAANLLITPATGSGMAIKTSQTLTGTLTGGYIGRSNYFSISDAIKTSDPSDFYENVTFETHLQTGFTGGRNSVISYLTIDGSPDITTTNPNYVAITGDATSNVNLGGSGLTTGTSKGAVFGGGFVGVLGNGATNLANLTGAEFNTAAQTGSSVLFKSLLQVSGRTDDAVAGTAVNAMFWAYNQGSGVVKWTDGILFDDGGTVGAWPISTSGTIIRTSSSGTVTDGINFMATTFSGGAIKVPLANVATTSAICYNTGTGLFSYNATVGTCTVSDGRLKNIEGRIPDALERLLRINGDYFTWKDPKAYGEGQQIGVVAQDVEKAFPELVSIDSEGKKSADYQRLVAPIIEAIRELKADNDNLNSLVTDLKNRIKQ